MLAVLGSRLGVTSFEDVSNRVSVGMGVGLFLHKINIS
jgi:hypothetical protein